MIIQYLSIILSSISFVMFVFTYRISSINRIITLSQKPIIESSIPLTVQDDEIVLYFDKELLKTNIDNYLEKEAKKYVEDYHVEYYFYNTENEGVCDVNDCQGVEINFEAKIMFGINYQRVMKYEIVEGLLHG